MTRFGCAADGREAIRCAHLVSRNRSRSSSRRKEALTGKSEFRIPNSEIEKSLLMSAELPGGCSAGVLACECTGRPARCSCCWRDAAATRAREGCATRLMGGRRFPSREGSGVGCFVQSPLFLSDLLTDHEPILTPSHEESLHSVVWSPAFRRPACRRPGAGRSGPAKAGTPNGRFMQSPLSFFHMHWGDESTPNPSREGNRQDPDRRFLPSWEGSRVGRFMESLRDFIAAHLDHEPIRPHARRRPRPRSQFTQSRTRTTTRTKSQIPNRKSQIVNPKS